MCTLRRDAPLVQDENAIGVLDGGQAMRDDERRAPLTQPAEGVEDGRLRDRVE